MTEKLNIYTKFSNLAFMRKMYFLVDVSLINKHSEMHSAEDDGYLKTPKSKRVVKKTYLKMKENID